MYDDRPTLSTRAGFEPPPGVCQSCNEKSDWRMVKVHVPGGHWRAAYAHNVLTGYESGKQPDWSKISMKNGMKFEGWLEFCNRCEGQPLTPNCTTLTQADLEAHKDATPESIRAMLAEAEGSMTNLPYDKYKRGGEV